MPGGRIHKGRRGILINKTTEVLTEISFRNSFVRRFLVPVFIPSP
jgi:hypothetical protein